MLPYSITLLLAISGFAVPFAVIMVAFVLYFMISEFFLLPTLHRPFPHLLYQLFLWHLHELP